MVARLNPIGNVFSQPSRSQRHLPAIAVCCDGHLNVLEAEVLDVETY
jgi:hypothetical protein